MEPSKISSSKNPTNQGEQQEINADILGASKSTASIVLHNAEECIIEEFFAELAE